MTNTSITPVRVAPSVLSIAMSRRRSTTTRINIVVMFATQKLTPTPIADPMQRKMMQYMPVAMGVMFAFFPAGLVLYWVTNGSMGLLQQWYMLRKYGDKPAVAAKGD